MISGRGCEAIGQDLIQPRAFSVSTLTGAAAAFTFPARTRSLPLLRELMCMIHAHRACAWLPGPAANSSLFGRIHAACLHRSRRGALAIPPSGAHAHDSCA